MKTTIELFSDLKIGTAGGKRARTWRWRLRDGRNGLIIGASSEAYSKRAGAVANLARVTGVLIDHWHLRGKRRVYVLRMNFETRTASFQSVQS